ncbi:MAG: histidine phosphatase family protein [Bacteroidetes bacterium]|nr:histidine phosphatase family protein [Bacteroidota bacterium]MBS1972762.1 histidine phosphatase family protein [Bacteroidota bacterium]
MKSLLLIRHAKSSWGTGVLNDFDRPLNERGKKDAPEMARMLMKNKVSIDCFVSSPAKRAKKTARLFIKELGRDENEIIYVPELYHASAQIFFKVISGLSDDHPSAAIFSHNPGITEFVNMLTEMRLDNMPTCGVFAVRASINYWKEFAGAEKKLWFFKYPEPGADY